MGKNNNKGKAYGKKKDNSYYGRNYNVGGPLGFLMNPNNRPGQPNNPNKGVSYIQNTNFNPLSVFVKPNGKGTFNVLQQSYGHNPIMVRQNLSYAQGNKLANILMSKNQINTVSQNIGGKI